MYIYIISSEENIVKIGISKNPEKRIKSLQTGHPKQLKIQYINEIDEENKFNIEKIIHKILKHKKIKNEWFNISIDEAKMMIEYVLIRTSEENIKTILQNNRY